MATPLGMPCNYELTTDVNGLYTCITSMEHVLIILMSKASLSSTMIIFSIWVASVTRIQLLKLQYSAIVPCNIVKKKESSQILTILPIKTVVELLVRSESQNGKDDQGRKYRCKWVGESDDKGIPLAILLWGIVTGESDDASESKAEREKYLSCGI